MLGGQLETFRINVNRNYRGAHCGGNLHTESPYPAGTYDHCHIIRSQA
jgi:hypothetical protein